MTSDINKRLEQMRVRRRGTDRLDRLTEDAKTEVLAKSLSLEAWEKRASVQPFTRYALGAMQEVGPDYTRISIETARRVGDQLDTGLSAAGFSVEFRLQGSVPLNVHIRGVSDVDLLSIDTSFLTYMPAGLRGRLGRYVPTGKTSISVLLALREHAEKILKAAFPAAKVDTSGGKAINISGGSLPRLVDVVPAHWHDTITYQASAKEHDRGITILNKAVPETIANLPFLHIKCISDRCDSVLGGLRKAIRLCKNVKAEAEGDGMEIGLPSFDIAAIMYHADLTALRAGSTYELAILAETQRHLDALACDHDYAKTFMVPDGSRQIFNTSSKLIGLNRLSTEMDALIRQVAKEQSFELSLYANPSLAESRRVAASIYLPTPA